MRTPTTALIIIKRQTFLVKVMEKKYKYVLISVAIALALFDLYIIHYFKIVGFPPLFTKVFLLAGIPSQIIAFCLVAWYFHKVSKKPSPPNPDITKKEE